MKEKICHYIKKHKILLSLLFISMISVFILRLLIYFLPGFPDWYAKTIYPIYINTISRILSPFPFSFSEILLIVLFLYIILSLLLFLYHRIRRKKSTIDNRIVTFFFKIITFVNVLLFIYTLTCGINYFRTPFSNYLGFQTEASSSEDLEALCYRLVALCNEYASKIPLNEDGLVTLPENANQLAVSAMKKLGETYSSLSGYYPNPKPVIFSEFMSYQFLTGIYSPFTVEANYNNRIPASDIPETMCHELSHLKGFMREDEAEFIAYLACIGSDNVVFQYSGGLTALSYSMNALYKDLGKDAYQKVWESLAPQIRHELQNDYQYWDQYRGTIAEIQDKVNDTYLKANAQTEGVKSYGRMVDLLIAYYKVVN